MLDISPIAYIEDGERSTNYNSSSPSSFVQQSIATEDYNSINEQTLPQKLPLTTITKGCSDNANFQFVPKFEGAAKDEYHPSHINDKTMVNNSKQQQQQLVSTCEKMAVLVTTTTSFFMLFFQFVAFSAYYVILTQHFGVSRLAAGWIGSIQNCMAHAGGILVAPFIRRVGSKRLVQASGFIVLIGYVTSALTPNVYLLYFTYGILTGFGSAIFYLCAIVEIQQTFSASSVATAQTIASLGISAGSIVASIVMPLLLDTFGWRGTMLLEGAALLHIIPLASAYRQHHSQSQPSSPLTSPAKSGSKTGLGAFFKEALDFSMFRDAMFVLFCIGRFNIWFAMHAQFVHTPSRAVSMGLTLQQGTLLVAFISMGTLSCRLILVGVTQATRVSIIAIAVVCSLTGAVFLIIVAFASSFYILAGIYVGIGLSLGTVATLLPPMVLELFGMSNLTRNQAVCLLIDGFAQLIAPPVAGAIVDLTGSYVTLYIILSGNLVIGGTIFFVIIMTRHKTAEKFVDVSS